MGREDDEKLAKMRRLLEILCNPSNKRLPMDTLKKCEAVLNRMQQQQDLGALVSILRVFEIFGKD